MLGYWVKADKHGWDTEKILVSRKSILLLIDVQKLLLRRIKDEFIRSGASWPTNTNTPV
jgi:hypothetical protein